MLEKELEDGRWSECEGWMVVMLLLPPVPLHPRRILRDHDPRGTKGLPRLQDLGRLRGDLALLVSDRSGRPALLGSDSVTIDLRPEVRSDVPVVQDRRRERRSRRGSERRWPSVGPGGRKPRLERRLMDAMLDANDRRVGETEHDCNNNNNSQQGYWCYWVSRQRRLLKLFVASCMKEC